MELLVKKITRVEIRVASYTTILCDVPINNIRVAISVMRITIILIPTLPDLLA